MTAELTLQIVQTIAVIAGVIFGLDQLRHLRKQQEMQGGAELLRSLQTQDIARAMLLTDVEREHLFLLALGRPPEVRYRKTEGVTPRLQRVLDSLEFSPDGVLLATADRSGGAERSCSCCSPRPGCCAPRRGC